MKYELVRLADRIDWSYLDDQVTPFCAVDGRPSIPSRLMIGLHNGRPYDGHTLKKVIDETEAISGIEPKRIYVDRSYRGHDYPNKHRVFRSGQKRGVTATIKKELRRRSVVEPIIGHLRNNGQMGRNYLKGQLGDQQNAV